MYKKNVFKGGAVSVDSENKYQIPIYSEVNKPEKKLSEPVDATEITEAAGEETPPLHHSDLNDDILSEHYEIEAEKEAVKEEMPPEIPAVSEEHIKEIERMYEEAEKYAEKTRGDAYRSAEIILNHTLSSARDKLEEAERIGYSQGFEEGKRQAESVISPALKKIGAFMNGILKVEDDMLREFREKMFLMVSESAKKLIHKEISANDDYIVSLFSDAMRDMRAEEFVTVTVSDYDADFVTAHKQLFLSEIGNLNDFRIITDKDASKGTLIIETEKSVVDASLGIQLENIDALFEKLKMALSIEEIKNSVDAVLNSAVKADDKREAKAVPNAAAETVEREPDISETDGDGEFGMDFDDLMMSEEEFEKLNL